MNKIIKSSRVCDVAVIKAFPNFLFAYPYQFQKVPFYNFSNVAPISVKRSYGNDRRAFWQPDDLEEFKKMIDHDFVKINNHLEKGAFLVMPLKDFGTETKIRLDLKAPKLYHHLSKKMQNLVDKYGINDTMNL